MDEEEYQDAFSAVEPREYDYYGKWLEYVFEGKFKCYRPDARELGLWFYKHENTEWKQDKDEIKVREAITTDGFNTVIQHMLILTNNLKVDGLPERCYELMRNSIKKLNNILYDLQDTEEITRLIKHIKWTFYDANFKPKSIE